VARDENGNVIRDKAGFTIPMVFGYDKITNTELYEFQGGDAIYEDILNQIKEQAGFLCVGHGYYVDMVTLQ
jgi:hypothetical protein